MYFLPVILLSISMPCHGRVGGAVWERFPLGQSEGGSGELSGEPSGEASGEPP